MVHELFKVMAKPVLRVFVVFSWILGIACGIRPNSELLSGLL